MEFFQPVSVSRASSVPFVPRGFCNKWVEISKVIKWCFSSIYTGCTKFTAETAYFTTLELLPTMPMNTPNVYQWIKAKCRQILLAPAALLSSCGHAYAYKQSQQLNLSFPLSPTLDELFYFQCFNYYLIMQFYVRNNKTLIGKHLRLWYRWKLFPEFHMGNIALVLNSLLEWIVFRYEVSPKMLHLCRLIIYTLINTMGGWEHSDAHLKNLFSSIGIDSSATILTLQ